MLVHPFAGLPLVVCSKRGRPAEPLPPLVVAHWDTARNGGQLPPASGRNSTRQAYFSLTCGQCSTKIQIKTVVKQGEAALECRLHGSSGRGISVWQQAAVALLHSLLGPGCCTVEQYRLLPVAQKPVDIVVEPAGLLVEVDGPQHAPSSTGFGEEAGAQCARDQQFERSVLSSGMRLLRLHWADLFSWPAHMQAALQRCRQQPSSSFIYYSASYRPERCVT